MPAVTHKTEMPPRTGQPANATRPLPCTFALAAQAYLQLVKFNYLLVCGNFQEVYDNIRSYPMGQVSTAPDALERVCTAINHASIWYPRQVLCLQRSAATACLLKKFGIAASLVVGVQQLPFKAHAWVEVAGRVVNDKYYVREMFDVLDQC